MKILGCLMWAICAATALASAGCGGDGYTPVCKPDFSDCLEQPKGGQWMDAGGDAAGDAAQE